MSAIELCFLEEHASELRGLQTVSRATKSQLKKLGWKKSAWERSLPAKKAVAFPADALNFLQINPVCSQASIQVLGENEDLLALSKPFNCHSHPLKYSDTNNVLSWLRSQGRGDLLRVNESSYDRGLLYRLDYETSGLLLYCKKEELFQKYREGFASLAKEKTYYAIVEGNFSGGEIRNRLVYGGAKNSKARAEGADHPAGVEANLIARQAAFNEEKQLSLLEVKLKEGRRHQIRVQLAGSGHPILGDTLYGGTPSERLFLHCRSYVLETSVLEGSGDDKQTVFEDPVMPLFSLFFDLHG